MLPFSPDKDKINSYEHSQVIDLHDLIFTRVRLVLVQD
jgi:hypothetical protein